jgi:autotransporter-associated beta strand protein
MNDSTGTLILIGSNTYTGTTTINAGTLQLGNNLGGFQYIGSGPIINNGTLVVETAGSLGLGSISGTGSLIVNSSNGTVGLSATNTYTGPTIINSGGTLQVGGNSIASSSNVIDNGVLSGSPTITSLSGNGILQAQVTLTNASGTFSGIYFPGSSVYVAAGNEILNVSANCGCSTNVTIASGASVQSAGGAFSVVDNGVFTIALPSGASILYPGPVSGSGSFTLSGAGSTLALTGRLTYTGPTTINSGATLSLFSGSIAASSGVTDNGTLDISTGSTPITALTGSGNVVTGSNILTISNASGTFSGVISGAGGLAINSSTQILSGINTYTGASTINSSATLALIGAGSIAASSGVIDNGTLDISAATPPTTAGVSIIALTGSGSVVTGTKALTITNASGTFSGVISGAGSVSVAGGTQILSGTNIYSGGTNVRGGTLNVTGTVGAVSVASGGTLAGTGKVGATSVASGGILSPGTGGAPGTLTMAGNLTMASGASYLTYFTPTAAGLTAVTGTASVAGTVTANAASGTYTAGQTYKLITATGGVTGTFASLSTPGLPSYVTGSLSYDANDVILNLNAVSLSSALTTSTSTGTGTSSSPSSSTVSSGNTGTGSSSSSTVSS